jgi:hypothetical protein
MPILPNPSASPLPSYASRPSFTARPVTLASMVATIWRWWRGRDVPSLKQQIQQAKLIDALADELAEDEVKVAKPKGTGKQKGR